LWGPGGGGGGGGADLCPDTRFTSKLATTPSSYVRGQILSHTFPWETEFMNTAFWNFRDARARERTPRAGGTVPQDENFFPKNQISTFS
jgi:hypothetical protein